MKSIPQRRHDDEKKSKKRWQYFLDLSFQVLGSLSKRTDCQGMYRKSKGCECRTCSYYKQKEKLDSNEKRRTEEKRLKKDMDFD